MYRVDARCAGRAGRGGPRRRAAAVHRGCQDGPMVTLGVAFLPQIPPERLRSIALAADQAGLEELWLWEDCFLQGALTGAAAALAWTETLRVGIGLVPVPLRNVAV